MTAKVEHGFNKSERIPPLESGDRLTRYEFERRYTAMPYLKKAELIEGVVYVASPVRSRSHAQPHAAIMGWLSAYWVAKPGVDLNDNATVRLDLDNEPQPDALLRLEESVGGQSHLSEDDYIQGAPELVVEIAASSATKDLYDKKRVYRRNGVQEYIVWQVINQKLDWFCWQDGDYISLTADNNGVIQSQVFPGLWLDVTALLTLKMTQVLAVLQAGLNSAEHTAFIQLLAEKINNSGQ
ncbi:Uma2 family endonuclease [Nostoc sp. UHCC 0302]|uniref:Uma2 family endonuclease n=1 Tax=Nostoc sp. UHCC 0302 TaxID=3134896 RepID=UPI00311C9097